MKRRSMKTITLAIILALTLSTGGLASGTWIPPSEAMQAANDDQTTENGTGSLVLPIFTTQPQSQAIHVGHDVVFSVVLTGDPAPALQWQISINGGETWTNLAGQTGTTLNLSNVGMAFNGNQYRIIVTNTDSDTDVVSNPATLHVVDVTRAQLPVITGHPADAAVISNDSVTLSVTAEITDRGTLTYQWFSSTTDRNTGGTAVRGATSRTFTPPVTSDGTIYYYVVITNTNNYVSGNRTATATSNTARVTVSPLVNAQAPEITAQPESEIVNIDGNAILIVSAESRDRGTISYQWFRNDTDSNTGGTPINGAIGASFTPPVNTLGTIYYYVVVTNTNNNINGTRTATVTSQAVSINVITTPDAPQNLTVVSGENNVVLRWEAPENDGGSEITGYQVSDNIVTHWIDANGILEHTFDGLFSDREYTFKVRAINAAGKSDVSEITASTTERGIINVTGISLDTDTLELHVGEYATLTAVLLPGDADDQSVIWSSSNPSVARVNSNGVVTAVAAGTATITVTSIDGAHTASCDVTVENPAGSNLLLWIGLGTLLPLGTGTGLYIRKRKNRKS